MSKKIALKKQKICLKKILVLKSVLNILLLNNQKNVLKVLVLYLVLNILVLKNEKKIFSRT